MQDKCRYVWKRNKNKKDKTKWVKWRGTRVAKIQSQEKYKYKSNYIDNDTGVGAIIDTNTGRILRNMLIQIQMQIQIQRINTVAAAITTNPSSASKWPTCHRLQI